MIRKTKSNIGNRARPRKRPHYPSLKQSPTPAERRAAVERRLKERGVKPMDDATLDAMGEVWPEDEDLDEFLAWLRKARRDGRYR